VVASAVLVGCGSGLGAASIAKSNAGLDLTPPAAAAHKLQSLKPELYTAATQRGRMAHASRHASKLRVRIKDNGIAAFGVDPQVTVNLVLVDALV
jgi:hypothetical protein